MQDGRPIPFNAYPPKSIINKFREAEHHSPPSSRPLWHGSMRSFWLSDVDRLLHTLPEQRQAILLGLHLPGRGTDKARAAELGVTPGVVASTHRMAREALERL